MESDAERSIVLRDSERIIREDHVQGTNATTAINSSGSTFKIDTLSIDLGIVKGKGNAQKCSHFSIRGYVAKMREKSGYKLPFSDGSGEDLPPIEVPCFRFWLCQSCLQNCRDGSASQEVPLVSECGKSIVQPCSTSYSTRDCHHLPILPFGEGTSGLKPIDKRNDDENIPTVLQGDTTQSLPDTPTNMEEPTKTDPKATNVDVKETDVEENVLGEVDDSNQGSMVVQSDDENDDPSGHLRRKARKVRLLAELMCGSTLEKHQRKENNLLDSGPSTCSPVASFQIKRKLSQAQDRRSIDVPTPGHAGKKAKVFKEGATLKTSLVERNTDKYICKKHGNPKGSKLSKVSSDPLTAWRSIFSDMGRSDKPVSVVKGTLKLTRDVSVPVSKAMSQLQPDTNSNATKKVVENPLRNQLLGKDIQRTNFGGSRVRDCDNGLGLGLSLHYEPQPEVSLGPSLPNRVSIHNHSSKAGLFYGESSITYRGVTSDPQAEVRSVYDVRDGHTPTVPLLTEQQHHHTQLSGIFSQRQNLDFSDPHNTRNSGVRGYSDVMGAHNHQRQEISSNGRSDEKEIAELLAKIQHERNLFEAKSYYAPGGSHDSGVSGTPIFCEVNNNKGMPLTFDQYPSMKRPSSSMLVTGENLNSGPTSVANLAGFFRQEPVPAFSKLDTFSHSQKQSSNGITIPDHGHQRLNNSYYNDFRGNDSNRIAYQSGPTNMREAFNEHHNCHRQNGTPRNLWSNIPSAQNMGMHTNWSNKKGKSVINLDLNVTASNGVEEQNELNPKHMGSMGSSYSNEAIPAMQLLSLMDAGNSSSTFVMDGKKFKPKPFLSCYNHHSSNAPGKPNSYLPYSARQSGVQKPMENPRNMIHGTSPLSAVTNSFSSFFHTDQTVDGHTNGHQFYLKPEPKKPKGVSTDLASHKDYNPDNSFVFPLPWHATEDRNGNVAQGALHPRNVTPGTETCSINQNPADFSIPGPGNVYMIGVEDLQFRGERYYKSTLASENIDVQKWQIRS